MKRRLLSLMFLPLMLLILLCGCAASDPSDAEGSGFPDLVSFTAHTLDGSVYAEKDLAAVDLTMINIWATYCGPCLREMPELAELERELPDNIALITYCTDCAGDSSYAEEILADAGFEGVTLVAGSGDLEDLLGVIQYVPTTVFVDSEGKMAGQAVIGAPSNAVSAYTDAINDALKSLGKDEI